VKQTLRRSGNEYSSEIVWLWFVRVRARNLPMSVTVMQEHAKEVAKKLGRSEFKVSHE
jgi:hypothetical protein